MEERSERRRLWTFRALMAALGLALSLVAAELVLRLVVGFDLVGGANSFTALMRQVETAPITHPIFRSSQDTILGYELVPGSQRGLLRINSHGLRGPEIAERAPEGVVRIAFLGDSETLATRLPEAETLPGVVQARLNRASTRTRYQALNFGVPGYNTAQEAHLLRTRVLDFGPSVVVLYYVFNDPEMTSRTLMLSTSPLARSYTYLFVTWLRRQHDSVEGLRRKHPDVVAYYRALHESEYFEAARELILGMGRLLSLREIDFIVVIAPEIVGFRSFDEYPYRGIHARLRDLGSPEITVVDPLDELAALGVPPRSLWVAADDPHKSARATRAIGELLARQILSRVEAEPRSAK